jgi:uncharacterized protein YndB with AHSA1/START domain
MTVTVEDDGQVLRAVLRLPGCSPERTLQAFTSPELLAQWWGNAALSTELAPGGAYDVFFAGIPARMTGRVIRYEPARALQLSWAWEHQPERPVTTLLVQVDPMPAGSTLSIEHGPYGDDEISRTDRQEHREGWEYFLPRLRAVLSGGD